MNSLNTLNTGPQVAQLIGKVFLQSSTVNLLSSVLDTPDFFWSEPDSLQARSRALGLRVRDSGFGVLGSRFQGFI